MNIYHYHHETGAYLGVGRADVDPLVAGSWLVPAYATPISPPSIIEGEAAVFAGAEWQVVEDHRDRALYTPLGKYIFGEQYDGLYYSGLGPIPEWLSTQPSAEPATATPTVVSRSQGLIALYEAGLLSAIKVIVDDPETDPILVIAWEAAQEFHRDSPTIAYFADKLELSEAQIDDLFTAASMIRI